MSDLDQRAGIVSTSPAGQWRLRDDQGLRRPAPANLDHLRRGQSLNYSGKFTLSVARLCLGLSGPNAELPAWSTIDVETCTGATEQKWNAVPNLLNSTVINTHEN